MNHIRSAALILSAVLGVSPIAGAQKTQEPATQEPTAEEQAWQHRFERAEGFRIKMLQTRRGVEMFYSFQKRNAESIEDNRTKCREDLRRANRDMKFPTLLRCYRREVVLNREWREKQRQYMESIPGVTEELRERAIAAIDDLISALDALLEGVENDVFANKEDLVEAKKNLHAAYRVPALLAILRTEADRNVTWIAHVLQRLLTMTQNTELGPKAFAKASEALTCFEEGETQLMNIGGIEEYEDANFAMSQSLSQLQTCIDLLKEAHRLQQLFENPPTDEEEGEENLSPRRRWKNL